MGTLPPLPGVWGREDGQALLREGSESCVCCSVPRNSRTVTFQGDGRSCRVRRKPHRSQHSPGIPLPKDDILFITYHPQEGQMAIWDDYHILSLTSITDAALQAPSVPQAPVTQSTLASRLLSAPPAPSPRNPALPAARPLCLRPFSCPLRLPLPHHAQPPALYLCSDGSCCNVIYTDPDPGPPVWLSEER